MIITVKDEDKEDIIPIAKRFEAQGYRIFATRGTANVLTENGIKVTRTNKLEQPSPNLMDLILGHKIDVVIDTPPQGVEHQKDGFVIRRNASRQVSMCLQALILQRLWSQVLRIQT